MVSLAGDSFGSGQVNEHGVTLKLRSPGVADFETIQSNAVDAQGRSRQVNFQSASNQIVTPVILYRSSWLHPVNCCDVWIHSNLAMRLVPKRRSLVSIIGPEMVVRARETLTGYEVSGEMDGTPGCPFLVEEILVARLFAWFDRD
jgi:hypothetical protein